MHLYDINSRRETVSPLLFGEDSKILVCSMSNELGRLAQGKKYGIKPTDKIDFIAKNEVPITSKVTYVNCTCNYRPLKIKQHGIRLIAGGTS